MTLLHQAAQKAVELEPCPFCGAAGEYRYVQDWHGVGCETRKCPGLRGALFHRSKEAAFAAWNQRQESSALQQQPEPVALERWGRAKRDGSVLLERMADGYWTPWHIAQQALSALQHQEVPSGETEAQREEVCKAWADLPDSLRCHPGLKRLYRALGGVRLDAPAEAVPPEVPREPVARNALLAAWRAPEPVYFEFDKKKPKPDGFAAYTVLQLHRAFADGVDAASPSTTRQQEVGSELPALNDGVPDAEAAMAYALKRWGYQQGAKECIAFYRGACWCVLAAAPSTPEKAGGVSDGVGQFQRVTGTLPNGEATYRFAYGVPAVPASGPLRDLGAYLARVLDEDQWAHAEALLLKATDGVKASGEALQRHRGEAPTADGMFPGESVAEAARSWQGWCEHRSMTGLALFLGKVAKLADGVVVDRALNTTSVADQKAANLIDNADGVSSPIPHPLPAQANDGGEHHGS